MSKRLIVKVLVLLLVTPAFIVGAHAQARVSKPAVLMFWTNLVHGTLLGKATKEETRNRRSVEPRGSALEVTGSAKSGGSVEPWGLAPPFGAEETSATVEDKNTGENAGKIEPWG